MNVQIEIDGEIYIPGYNNQADYYELYNLSFETPGIHIITVKATDIFGNEYTETLKVQVLVVENNNQRNEEDIAYIIGYRTLKIKDIQKVADYTVATDDETNESSSITLAKKFNGEEKDYILLKRGYNGFLGILKDLEEVKNEGEYTVKAQDISNIFDEKIFLSNENVIKETGIEDFIKLTIENYFNSSYDTVMNLGYIDVILKSHTKLQKSVDVDESGLYNFHTFITNCKQNYDIEMTYKIENQKLIITIEKKEETRKFIDCTVADIIDYKKVYGQLITAKVEVFCTDTNKIEVYCLTSERNVVHAYTLNSNSEILEDFNIEDRVIGLTERITIENSEEAYQNAVDKFKGNDYNYLIQFSLSRFSKLMNVNDLITGTPVNIKTKENIIVNGYITAKTEEKNSNIVEFKAGKIRRTLRQQLKKGEVGK